jgi:hypothetical protein
MVVPHGSTVHLPPGYQVVGVTPVFSSEGPEYYQQAYDRNAPFAEPSSTGYQTRLDPMRELMFRRWVADNRVPFDPDAAVVDYDMRGYFNETGGSEWAGGGAHFPDTYKTPYDTSFSNDSMYAKPGTPFVWQGDDLVDTRNGQLVFRSGG